MVDTQMRTMALERFAGGRYLNLETYKRNGDAVATPLWFVEDGGVLYVRTFVKTSKVKRLRNNPQVRVVPSDKAGSPEGEWIEARARITEGMEAKRANHLLNGKYGMMKRLADGYYRFKLGRPIMIALDLAVHLPVRAIGSRVEAHAG